MGDWVNIGALDDLSQGQGVRVEIGSDAVAVFRIGDDVYAIGDRCSHAQASLSDGEVFDHDVECPRHGSEFSLETGVPHSLPATMPVPVFETKVEDGSVLVRVGETS
ncbi:anthranilate 1,2-dioxygenase ferredoxin subunit [bacterium BMS3Abin02]|nr:anthranilate 1,2-dioxygenase ferredoxin subunit [bacterium BMS3Abin02]GBE22757.1 anthranilate 1,2-dioxygenase ferredoxin subunit [bacterium BMS3Bbin01]HDK45527.1 non-heme iron oxygenase ferredoxin subunit [Actinomycetota bacterium]HDL49955.1 non-heme iron oxygenase ferredoxin subunit [Actinomycetota bacterium]